VQFVRRRRASKNGCSPDRTLGSGGGASASNHVDDHCLGDPSDDVSGFLAADSKFGMQLFTHYSLA